VLPDRYLRTPKHPAIFVAGDIANVLADDEHAVLMSYPHAMQLGKFAGEDAARDLMGEAMLPFRQERYVTCLVWKCGRNSRCVTHRLPTSDVTGHETAVLIELRRNGLTPLDGGSDDRLHGWATRPVGVSTPSSNVASPPSVDRARRVDADTCERHELGATGVVPER